MTPKKVEEKALTLKILEKIFTPPPKTTDNYVDPLWQTFPYDNFH